MEQVRIILAGLWVALMLTYLLGDVLRIFAGDFVAGEIDGKKASDWMWTLVNDGLRDQFMADRKVGALVAAVQEAVAAGVTTPGAAARRLLEAFKRS